jgi:hypothetical protein
MHFRISGLSPEPFRPLFRLTEAELAARGAKRMQVDAYPGYPDRITLSEVPVGETVLLVNHTSQMADTPYRASHAIFVWEGADTAYDAVDRIPEVLETRMLSLRGFDRNGMMVDADLAQGAGVPELIARLFADPAVETIHAHNARRGCFAARIERA